MIKAVSVMAVRSGGARSKLTKYHSEPMSGTRGQGSPPPRTTLQMSASSSKVLAAMDSCFSTPDFRPDEDGIIDLTTPENDALYDAVRTQPNSRRPSKAGL